MKHALLALTVCVLTLPAFADEVHLANGGYVEGHARRVDGAVVVETPNGELHFKAEDVTSIVPGKTRHDLYVERRDALLAGYDAEKPGAHVALGDWCKDEGLTDEARRHWRRALELDPDNRGAHARLGHLRYEGRWLTEEEYYEARGYVRQDGKWVPKDQVEREEAERQAAEALREHVKFVQGCVAKMGSMKRKTRLAGRVALQEYAEGRGDLRLAAFASQVADHYNEGWRTVKVVLERGSALTEVRATSATLKRPIPEIQTSLGAFSTPVRIQLPELKVISVRTTALIPAQIELDDE